ncbi:MAG: hypothetical protein AAB920_00955, partial [Patescibacteria group bacterium]
TNAPIMPGARRVVSRRTMTVGEGVSTVGHSASIRVQNNEKGRAFEKAGKHLGSSTGPKFSTIEIILGSLICIILDILAAIGDFFSFSLLGTIVQFTSWFIFTFWFTIKGCKVTSSLAKRFLVPFLVQLIPFIPTLIFTFLVTVYMENHPEKFAVVQAVEKVANKVPIKK